MYTYKSYIKRGWGGGGEILLIAIDFLLYTRKNARSITVFNSTDIRAKQDNVATPVIAMMVTVCISTDIRPATELM